MPDLVALRQLPSIEKLLLHPELQEALEHQGREIVVQAARSVLADAREAIAQDGWQQSVEQIPSLVSARVATMTGPPLRPVLNATGVIIHTNLGRAPLSPAALDAVRAASDGYSNLEYNLAAGARGSRHELVTPLLRALTGAEDALVVNNNAGAMLLILSALAHGRDAVISRGQLVEIGGGFRIPDVLRQSGAGLVEVGTTNRTYASDYAAAIDPARTALVLRVHSSNFRVLGFTAMPSLSELVAIAAEHGLPLVDDLGSGSLLDTSRFGMEKEPMVQESVQAGCALVAFSGDKLLGGPQAGIIVGHRALIGALKRHPLTRALRPDRMTLAALSATLVHYLKGEAEEKIPVWRMIAASVESLGERANTLIAYSVPHATLIETRATVGGGSLPGESLPSRSIAFDNESAFHYEALFRLGDPAVIGRVEKNRFLLDMRSVLPEQDDALGERIRAVMDRVST